MRHFSVSCKMQLVRSSSDPTKWWHSW